MFGRCDAYSSRSRGGGSGDYFSERTSRSSEVEQKRYDSWLEGKLREEEALRTTAKTTEMDALGERLSKELSFGTDKPGSKVMRKFDAIPKPIKVETKAAATAREWPPLGRAIDVNNYDMSERRTQSYHEHGGDHRYQQQQHRRHNNNNNQQQQSYPHREGFRPRKPRNGPHKEGFYGAQASTSSPSILRSATPPAPNPQLKFDDVEMRALNAVCFFGPRHFLSPLHYSSFTLAGNHYFSVDHYYQVVKIHELVSPAAAAQLARLTDAQKLRAQVRELLAPVKRRDASKLNTWRVSRAQCIYLHALVHSFAYNPNQLNQLISTADGYLAQCNCVDPVYGTAADEATTLQWLRNGNDGGEPGVRRVRVPVQLTQPAAIYSIPTVAGGKNVYGWLLMKVRRLFRQNPKRDLETTAQWIKRLLKMAIDEERLVEATDEEETKVLQKDTRETKAAITELLEEKGRTKEELFH